jgi:hypothetical protein
MPSTTTITTNKIIPHKSSKSPPLPSYPITSTLSSHTTDHSLIPTTTIHLFNTTMT